MATTVVTAETAAAPPPSAGGRVGTSPMERLPRGVRPLQYLALALYLLFLAFPLLWLLSTSFASPQDLVRLHPGLFPEQPTLDNFVTAFSEQALVRSIVNSLVVALASALLTVALALPASYAVVRLRSRLGKPILAWVLVSQLFPFILLVIPIFLLLRSAQLVDTRPGLVLIYVVWILPFALWMLQGYVRELPEDIEEAAMVDGASRLRILRSIIFPLLLPGVVATTLFAFITAWNEFFFALVLIKSPELETLPLTLARFVGLEGVARLGPLAAGALVATIPGLVFFGFIQKGLIGGMTAGATKG
ncbi:carbohydrate ABC transporter permease [Georgenia sp. TF02-10]|uniref:carbohydrate ABC transporter permease n=1 Tax=Georgenia sp. TF02-10 TaxID=2917725 RepID=UPI001FA7DA9A|nr:carbohydrate ABC transporter permease [Georgenia sp. TF02-10]UNX54832.1 carbohydrate ABC transporter permease [Georgenia sp. TF02-10]